MSLVINLTKHIHLKTQGNSDDVDTDEYSQYFPSFMWVVRDFALQLVDSEGEPITPKDYLEKALEQQKGFSDNIESKNRIRRLLKSFFKDRDCCTMIRPLVDEEALQNLAKMELDELRADFVEQVMQLRRKVINRIKPKTLNGKRLNGPMLSTLASSYVNSINDGAVPNIENAWTYICKSECQKAVETGMTNFEDCLKDLISFPCEEYELKENYLQAKKEALAVFKKKAVGNVDEFEAVLKEKMKHVHNQIKEDNERESINLMTQYLQDNYVFIERKLKNKEFLSFFEYDQEIKGFQAHVLEHGPCGPHKRVIILEFTQRVSADAAEYLGKTVNNELELQKTISVDQIEKLQKEIKEIKGDHNREKDDFESKLRSVEVQKAELSAVEQGLRENLQHLQQEKLAFERELMEKIQNEKKQSSVEIEEALAKLQNSENNSKEV